MRRLAVTCLLLVSTAVLAAPPNPQVARKQAARKEFGQVVTTNPTARAIYRRELRSTSFFYRVMSLTSATGAGLVVGTAVQKGDFSPSNVLAFAGFTAVAVMFHAFRPDREAISNTVYKLVAEGHVPQDVAVRLNALMED